MDSLLITAMSQVIEPDLGETIVDLGMVRAARFDRDRRAQIDIIMTTEYSPSTSAVVAAVDAAARSAGASEVAVRVVAEPSWSPYDIAQPLRALLGLPDQEPPLPGEPAGRGWLRGLLAATGLKR